ncbi:lipid-binding SYLF domain-containing protein [Campylobacter sp. FMV-PI01]|uniref:Lipid-binding SYLF domain-containing protein n=1 Tax=Campylobacter portucalensis TaxID=2608384 RepID=A0A6L5WIN9_9BACT|nr:lipid-binding SYLF domain-containing protein [Campylobacter portucalensis]MSN97100.1 lipid-binding SYLF domain-containing protein [Campylobacter portucalensis]
MKKLLFFLAFCVCLNADVFQNQQLYAATNVVNAFGCGSDKSVNKYIKNAKAIAILTDVRRGAAVVSTQEGSGVFSMKDENGNWSSPIMLTYKGFGIGLQAGYESNDVVLLFQSSKSFRDIFKGKETLEIGASASFINGKMAGVSTDIPEISSWIIKRGDVTGIYFGATLDIGKITIDNQATNDLYDRIYTYEDILNNSPKDTKYIKLFKETLTNVLNYGSSKNCNHKNAAKKEM